MASDMERDSELVREALELAQIYVPADWDNADVCLVRDAKEAFGRINTRANIAPVDAGATITIQSRPVGDAGEGWQPIETAPRDGAWIHVYWPTMGIGMYPMVVFWDDGWQPAHYSDRDYGEVSPTHWMPLPAAPGEQS